MTDTKRTRTAPKGTSMEDYGSQQWPTRHELLLKTVSDPKGRKCLFKEWLRMSQHISGGPLVHEWQITLGWALLGWPDVDARRVHARLKKLLATMPLNPYLPVQLQKAFQRSAA